MTTFLAVLGALWLAVTVLAITWAIWAAVPWRALAARLRSLAPPWRPQPVPGCPVDPCGLEDWERAEYAHITRAIHDSTGGTR